MALDEEVARLPGNREHSKLVGLDRPLDLMDLGELSSAEAERGGVGHRLGRDRPLRLPKAHLLRLEALILSAVAEGDVMLQAVWPPERIVRSDRIRIRPQRRWNGKAFALALDARSARRANALLALARHPGPLAARAGLLCGPAPAAAQRSRAPNDGCSFQSCPLRARPAHGLIRSAPSGRIQTQCCLPPRGQSRRSIPHRLAAGGSSKTGDGPLGRCLFALLTPGWASSAAKVVGAVADIEVGPAVGADEEIVPPAAAAVSSGCSPR